MGELRKRLFRVTLLVILLFINNALGLEPEDEISSYVPQRVTVFLKYASIDIETENDRIILSITKNGADSTMRNILYTDEPQQNNEISIKPLSIEENCGEYKTCIWRGENLNTIIEILPDRETVRIMRETPSGRLRDCYNLFNASWYGGPQTKYQYWPIEAMIYNEEPYLPTHQTNMAIAERYWLSSEGFRFFVNETVPLFLDQNNIMKNYICFVAKNAPPYRYRNVTILDYTIGVSSTPRLSHENVIKQYFGKPSGHPDVRMIEHPIWSTWARYKVNVSELVVNEFANEIISHGFNNSQLEIDDNWETCYGSATFDPVKFPNITRLAANLKKKGFRVTLWIHPFINEGCEPAYSQALKNGYFVKNLDGNVRMSWWQGVNAATIDFTNSAAVNWWTQRLRLILRSGIDGFKFDAGEVSWLPQVATLNATMNLQPGAFTTEYVTALAKNFDDKIEVRVGWRTQKLPIFVRMIDKDTRWSWENGLPTLVTTLLQMNLNGYVHVLPDMIGGNGYLNNSLNGTYLPSRELFVRWLQANVFMPALQYSFVPWDFDNEIVNISKKFTDLHARVTPIIVRLMKKSVATGEPLNPPIWWIAPTDTIAHKINDAYLLGEEILVAPVLKEGAIKRDVYLPSGKWKDPNQNLTHTSVGGLWLRDYPAPLNTLPYFVKEINGTYTL